MNVKFEKVLSQQTEYFGYMVKADSYELLYINENLKSALNLTDDSYIGGNCYSILSGNNSPCSYCTKNDLKLNEGTRRNNYNKNYKKCCLTTETITTLDGINTFVSTSYDITREFSEMDNFKQSSIYNNTIVECAKTLLDRDNVNETMSRLLQIVCDYYDGELSLLYERDTFSKRSKVEHMYCSPNANQIQKSDISSYNFEEIPTWTQLLHDSTQIFLKYGDDNLHLYNYPDLFLKEEGSNLLIVPLKQNAQVLGVIEIKDIKKNLNNFNLVTTISAFVVNNMEVIKSKKELEDTVSALYIKSSFNQVVLDCVQTLMDDDDNVLAVSRLLETLSIHFAAEGTYILQRDTINVDMFTKEHIFNSPNSNVYNNLCDISFNEINDWYSQFNIKKHVYLPSAIDSLRSIGVDNCYIDILKANNITSFAITPIIKNDVVSGYVLLCNPTQNTNDMSLLNIVTAFLINHIVKNELVQNLEFLSYTDKLTGLYNRNYYMNCIERLRLSKDTAIGIIFADVNGLKRANDNFGHELGDTLIKWCGNFFKKLGGDSVFRIGGDEFICFFEGISQKEFEDKVDIINENLYKYGDVHVSIGHIWSNSSKNIEDLIKESDELMYKQKQKYYANKKNDRRATADELKDFQRSIINLKSELS